MEAICSSGTPVDIYQTTRRYIPEEMSPLWEPQSKHKVIKSLCMTSPSSKYMVGWQPSTPESTWAMTMAMVTYKTNQANPRHTVASYLRKVEDTWYGQRFG
jgi:hypothetical protein